MQSLSLLLRAVCAAFLMTSTLYLAYGWTYRLHAKASRLHRWAGTIIVGMALALGGFFSLFALRLYQLPVAMGALALLSFSTHRWCISVGEVVGLWREDGAAASLGIKEMPWWGKVLALVFVGWWSWVCVRVLLLPPLAWDTVTYHAPRAAMWLQYQGAIPLEAPGGWSFQKYFSPGSEIFLSWSMMPFHSDLWMGAVDIFQGIALAGMLYALACELGLRPVWAVGSVLFFLTTPLVSLMVGSGYAEIPLLVGFAGMLLFGISFMRGGEKGALWLSWLALGVMASTKFHALVLAGAWGFFLLWGMWQHRQRLSRSSHLVSFILALALLLPWPLYVYNAKGTPLYPMRVKLGSLTLGEEAPALTSYRQRPALQPFLWKAEMASLYAMFSPAISRLPRLGAFLALCWLLAWLGWWVLFRRERVLALGIGTLLALSLALYLFPQFAVIRLYWALVAGRFLLPACLLVLLLTLLGFQERKRFGWLILALGGIFALHHAMWPFRLPRARQEDDAISFALLFCFALACLLFAQTKSLRLRRFLPLTVLCAWLGATFLLEEHKTTTHFSTSYRSMILDSTPKSNTYWLNGFLRYLKKEHPQGTKIAVTSGFSQNADNWWLYPLLGKRFQHRLHYVPITRASEILPYGEAREKTADLQRWIERLRKEGIRYIVSFAPAGIERQWMKDHPRLFQPLSFSNPPGAAIFALRTLP
jgi:hypothetical protein